MIDNLHQIKSLLNFEKEGDFYMLYVLKRKKDQTTDKSNHQSVRTIKTYCVESVEYLEKRYDEIKELCEMFKARAYIHVQKQSHHDVSLNMLVALAERIRNGQHRQQHLFDSVVGQLKTLEKRWIIDIDGISIDGFAHAPFYKEMRRYISELQNETGKEVEMTFIPTRAGFHIIASPFKERYHEVDVHKKNPTLLFLPDSLN